MTNSYRQTPQETFALMAALEEEERLRQEAILANLQPSTAGNQGPDFIPGEAERAIALREAAAAEGPLPPEHTPIREFTGDKYETREDGGTDETDEYLRHQRAEQTVRGFDENPLVQTLQGGADVAKSLVQGTGDTFFGALKGMGWLMGSTQSGWDELAGGPKGNNLIQQGTAAVDDYWHQVNPQSDNGAHHAIRKMWESLDPQS